MIGVFDSGVGGLSVWREIVARIPDVPTTYLADQAHVPYGERPLDEVRALTLRAAGWLIERGCSAIVIACNTASAAALEDLRATFPQAPFVGMEPAIKPAALCTQTGTIGVLATAGTFGSRRYAGLVTRWGRHVRIIQQPCRGWVNAVEQMSACAERPAELARLVASCVTPLLNQNADVLVLGCTHFPFLRLWIERAIEAWQRVHPAAHEVRIIDPAPAVARRTHQVWGQLASARAGGGSAHQLPSGEATHEFWTTGSPDTFAQVASALLGYRVMAQSLTL